LQSYYFISTWKIAAPVQAVWDAIENSEAWPQWWPGVLSVKKITNEFADGHSDIKEYIFGSYFFYKIKFRMRTVEKEDFFKLKGIATGDADGVGLWKFQMENGICTIQYQWDITITVKWMNLLAPIFKHVFKLNHHLAMKAGGKALAKRLSADLISDE
jgi:uncharacterized protein YndB with AHSA1/START domain